MKSRTSGNALLTLDMGGPQHAGRQFPIARFAAVMLFALGSISLVLYNCFVAAAQQAEQVWYQGETRIGASDDGACLVQAGAGTLVAYDSRGVPSFIGFAELNGKGEAIVQGEYGMDGTVPKNKGRIIYRQISPDRAMPYLVIGAKDIRTYHLSYLELTTVSNDGKVFRAYATKATAFDNKVETLSKQPSITYALPEGGQLSVDHGQIKFGDSLVSPNYDLTGKTP